MRGLLIIELSNKVLFPKGFSPIYIIIQRITVKKYLCFCDKCLYINFNPCFNVDLVEYLIVKYNCIRHYTLRILEMWNYILLRFCIVKPVLDLTGWFSTCQPACIQRQGRKKKFHHFFSTVVSSTEGDPKYNSRKES